jgi:hypothetical protein
MLSEHLDHMLIQREGEIEPEDTLGLRLDVNLVLNQPNFALFAI